jgi:N-dimethylarginine dimethylaminohydrolase
MCEPTGYTVNYEINPYMKASVIDPAKALRQWRSVKDALIDGGAHVDVVPGDPRYPDMVFVANAAQIVRDRYQKIAVMARFKSEHRAGEAELWAERMPSSRPGSINYLMSINAKGAGLHSPFFEGQGDVITFDGMAEPGNRGNLYHYIIGFGQRTSCDGARYVNNVLDMVPTTQTVTSIELQSPYFYHLDTCVFAGEFACLVIENAIGPNYRPALIKALQFEKADKPIIYVTEEEGKTLCCNMVETSTGVVVSGILPPRIKAELEKVGYKCIEVDTSEFLKAGGSVRCMTLDI